MAINGQWICQLRAISDGLTLETGAAKQQLVDIRLVLQILVLVAMLVYSFLPE